MGFAAFAGQKYLNLETFKKNGTGVKTPVWFAEDPSAGLDSSDAKLYVYTIGVSGKVKRILKKKYFPWKQLLDFFAKFRNRDHTVFVLRPA